MDNRPDRVKTPEMFSRIARRYDLLNHVLSFNQDRRWRRDLVKFAAISRGGTVLDACTGTGDVAVAFARFGEASGIVGVDLSAEMLLVGRRKVLRNRLDGRIRFVEGDVLCLPFEDQSFDAAVIAFGLRNLPDYRYGIVEMARVLKRGGRMMILEFSPPKRGLFLHGYRVYLRSVIPFVGGLISGSKEAYRYLASSIDDFLTGEEIAGMMGEAGLSNISTKRLAGGVAYIYRGCK